MQFNMDKFPTRKEAFEGISSRWNPEIPAEMVPLEESVGRVTARDLYSQNTLPVMRSAACDTYAFKSEAFADGTPDTSTWVEGVDFVRADMGDDFPDIFDTCTQVENVDRDSEGHFAFNDRFEFIKGDCVNKQGSTIKKGTLILKAHTKITAELLPPLATGGIRMVPVFKKIRVGYIPTGTELIPTGTVPQRGDTVECNGIMIKAMLERVDAECIRYPIVADNETMLEGMLDEALESCDIVLINGGSSKGSEDFNKLLLERRGSYHTYGVRCTPGKPVGIALINDKPVINIPGPVLAAWLAVDWLVCGLVYHYYGIPMRKRPVVKAKMTGPLGKRPNAECVMRVSLKKTADGYEASPIPREAGVVGNTLMHGQITMPPESKGLSAGDIVDCELLVNEELL